MEKIIKSFQYGENTLTLETGRIARQASGSVLASLGETVILATVVGNPNAQPLDFLPLTIDMEEKTYAAGKIPGGFFKREGRPSENAILTARLIDRPLRPLFPKGFYFPVQVVINVMSLDPEINPDILALIASSAALQISGIPQKGVMGAARVAYINGEYILNPSKTQLTTSDLDLVVAGTENAVLMVESEAKILTEEQMLGAVIYGHDQAKIAIQEIKDFASQVKGITPWEFTAKEEDPTFVESIRSQVVAGLSAAYSIVEKQERKGAIGVVREALLANLEDDGDIIDRALKVFSSVEKSIVRTRVIEGNPRIDGRDTKTVRPIAVETGILPRTHGSALFTRGETQAIVVTTLGSDRDAQNIDSLDGERKEHFMLHYNFPPYSVGEVGRVGSPKRREIGHGNLAKRSVKAVLPDDYPYVLRVVSEITESNGSSSMASVCGASLSLMDAGVPIKAPVAGIAMGLIKEGEAFSVLTDILGDEDHLGDMDFKVAGTDAGITALQMDIKIEGITREIMDIALVQAKEARLHILGEMAKVISTSRSEISAYAPRIETIKIHTDKIRDVIGKGGATIRAITEETGVSIDIQDDGTINIVSADKTASDLAKKRIEDITADVEIGRVYDGKVVKLMDFGAFVAVMPGKEGLVHISQLSQDRVEKVSDVVSEGQEVKVKVLEIDKQGRIRLSMKAVDES